VVVAFGRILKNILWHGFLALFHQKHMDKNQEFEEFSRNRPAEKGTNNDPNIRDEDARQGASTMSTSKTDRASQELTKTSQDSFRETTDDNADARFNDVDREEEEGII
jgi:hypothetical protein